MSIPCASPMRQACALVSGARAAGPSSWLTVRRLSSASAAKTQQQVYTRNLHACQKQRSVRPQRQAWVGSTLTRHYSSSAGSDVSSTSSSSSSSASSASSATSTDTEPRKPAFGFDIDGVLKQGSNVLQETYRALDILDGANKRKEKVPYVFITNGGGVTEADRAALLSKEFKREVEPEQVIQAHTVLRVLLDQFENKDILVIGGPERNGEGVGRAVMQHYGFKKCHTVHDVMHWHGSVWPFKKLDAQEKKMAAQTDFSKIRFAAVLVFHDSRDWGRDIQLICDVLRSPDGTIGRLGDDTHEQPYLAFSHGDLIWGTDFPTPRFGQGAFQHAVRAVYEAASGRSLVAQTFGKPETLTYAYANDLLAKRAAAMSGGGTDLRVWMIGDNPASDIMGANGFGWESALVRTGVFTDLQGPPAHKPTIIVDNVEDAVRQALEKEWGVGNV